MPQHENNRSLAISPFYASELIVSKVVSFPRSFVPVLSTSLKRRLRHRLDDPGLWMQHVLIGPGTERTSKLLLQRVIDILTQRNFSAEIQESN